MVLWLTTSWYSPSSLNSMKPSTRSGEHKKCLNSNAPQGRQSGYAIRCAPSTATLHNVSTRANNERATGEEERLLPEAASRVARFLAVLCLTRDSAQSSDLLPHLAGSHARAWAHLCSHSSSQNLFIMLLPVLYVLFQFHLLICKCITAKSKEKTVYGKSLTSEITKATARLT